MTHASKALTVSPLHTATSWTRVCRISRACISAERASNATACNSNRARKKKREAAASEQRIVTKNNDIFRQFFVLFNPVGAAAGGSGSKYESDNKCRTPQHFIFLYFKAKKKEDHSSMNSEIDPHFHHHRK